MKTKIMKPLLAMACLLGSLNVSAYDFIENGIYYEVISINDLTCKITHGDEEYTCTGDIVIPDKVTYNNRTFTVTEIGESVFSGCSGLTSITIPNSVIKIGNRAFYGCSGLIKLIIEDGTEALNMGENSSNDPDLFRGCPLTSLYLGRNLYYKFHFSQGPSHNYIYYSPFKEMSTLKEVTIGNFVTYIQGGTFYGCSGLTSINIPNSVTEIGNDAFWNCSGLTSVIIPNSVTKIGSFAFQYCSGLTSITIPNSVTEIDKYVFCNCSSLTCITIPSSVTRIGVSAFSGCSGLTCITIPSSVTRIGVSAFSGCSGLTSITIPNSVTRIDEDAFYGCSSLTNVIIPNSVTRINEDTFSDCSSLTNVIIPNSVDDIGQHAFYGCSSLTSVTIGNSVTSISNGAFGGCPNLTELYSLNPTPPYVYNTTFTGIKYENTKLYVPQGSLSAYQNAEEWWRFGDIIEIDPTGVEAIKVDDKAGNNIYYDIQGRKLNVPQRGLNIINGKKVLMK